ncbi:hypothetical protein IV38_GL000121 [Lactobacillus selangorensis]|uniref:Uncharacterized protein n=1 Tax=Lactobacillus selangorensis TaxID=81857 RepID=A0A0R2FSF9_9LACO|nr:hypothetical protein [Lactobacillus selangorensis]KRN29241.1 hypothetical protein IV38_GL000121 [Lactobacillus selangorensis]KRN31401.1 hypothetical protein IV40_GL001397 [Lactobacillus selangorensis]
MKYTMPIIPLNSFKTQKGLMTPDKAVYDSMVSRGIYAPDPQASWFQMKASAGQTGGPYLEPSINNLMIGDKVTIDADITQISGSSKLDVSYFSQKTDSTILQVHPISLSFTEARTHVKAQFVISAVMTPALVNGFLPEVWLNFRSDPKDLATNSEAVVENIAITVDSQNAMATYDSYDAGLLSGGDIERVLFDNQAFSESNSSENYQATYDLLSKKQTGFSLTDAGLTIYINKDGEDVPHASDFKGIALQHIPSTAIHAFGGYIEYESTNYMPVRLMYYLVDYDGSVTSKIGRLLTLKPDHTGKNKQYFFLESDTEMALSDSDKGKLAFYNIEVGSRVTDNGALGFQTTLAKLLVHQDRTFKTGKYVSLQIPTSKIADAS